jgi:hypothetical protein
VEDNAVVEAGGREAKEVVAVQGRFGK